MANWMLRALSMVVTGLGMFSESFVIFTTGQIKTLWKSGNPTCWTHGNVTCPNNVQCEGPLHPYPSYNTSESPNCTADGFYPPKMLCDPGVISAVSYIEFAGIMLGMLLIALVADKLGRRTGGIMCATIMLAGVMLMSLSPWQYGLNNQFTAFVAFYGIFGFGVGGEYPISASTATELTQEDTDPDVKETPNRGRMVTLTFAMQGVGAVFGSIIVLILLASFDQGKPDCSQGNEMGYDPTKIQIIWRLIYAIAFVILFCISCYRIFLLKESASWEREQQAPKSAENYIYNIDSVLTRYFLAFRYFWPRILATGGCWFLWDVAFYGNKLFSGPIFSILVPDKNLITVNEFILLNNVVALTGYYTAALIIDHKWVGRVRLQIFGSTVVALLFLFSGIFFTKLQAESPRTLLFLYIFSSFWGQCGPNVVTFVSPTELYPVRMRATCHGMSAFFGKCGALLATVIFGYLDLKTIFIVCAVVCALTAVLTLFFLPNVTFMELSENDRFLQSILTGSTYDGEVHNPDNLSLFERYVQRRDKLYGGYSGYQAAEDQA